MRKYYTQQSITKRISTTPVSAENAHWDLLSAYANGQANVLGLEKVKRIHEICKARDAKSYLDLASEFDDLTQSYTSSMNPEVIFVHRQIACLLKKFPFSKEELNIDTRVVALEKWAAAEDQCKLTNLRLRSIRNDELPDWVRKCQRIISDTLGPLSPSIVMKIINDGTHGPGATLTSQNNRTTPYYKYADFPYSVTKAASKYALAAISANPQWMEILENSGRRTNIPLVGSPLFQKEMQIFWDCVDIAENDKITFVPKDARTDRPIAISASLNLFLQLGVSTHLTRELKKKGVDLTDQSRNQRLAYEGSRYCEIGGMLNPSQFSTIDLASASDTVSIEIVKLLLPAEWYAFLSDLRHEAGDLDGNTHIYEKFSAMGNGYTFALESLIFWAVAKAAAMEEGHRCTYRDISVFGDDIIVRNTSCQAVIDALEWSGFSVNQEKSFLTGPFKESCGADFFMGTNVRPFYLKRRIDSYGDIYFVCNSIARLCKLHSDRKGLVAGYHILLQHIPRRHVSFVPLKDTSDSGLCVPLDVLNELGIRPWLSKSEIRHLIKHRLLRKEDANVQSMMYCSTIVSARTYSGKGSIRLMLSLSKGGNLSKFYFDDEKLLHMVASSAGNVTRRKAIKHTCRVAPILNWNGDYTKELIYAHPYRWETKKASVN